MKNNPEDYTHMFSSVKEGTLVRVKNQSYWQDGSAGAFTVGSIFMYVGSECLSNPDDDDQFEFSWDFSFMDQNGKIHLFFWNDTIDAPLSYHFEFIK